MSLVALLEQPVFEATVRQIQTTDIVIGGPDGPLNLQALELANRTLWLYQGLNPLLRMNPDFDSGLWGTGVVDFTAVYFDSTTKKYEKALNNDPLKHPIGIRLGNKVIRTGVYRLDSLTLTQGATYYLSNTSTITTAFSDVVIGIAISATELQLALAPVSRAFNSSNSYYLGDKSAGNKRIYAVNSGALSTRPYIGWDQASGTWGYDHGQGFNTFISFFELRSSDYTTANSWSIGDQANTDKTIYANTTTGINDPYLRYSASTGRWQFSDNGAAAFTMVRPSDLLGLTGTTANNYSVGNGASGDKKLTANNSATNKPFLVYTEATARWGFSNDGLTVNAMVIPADVASLQGTTSNTYTIGDGQAGDKTYAVNIPGTFDPFIRFRASDNRWMFSNSLGDQSLFLTATEIYGLMGTTSNVWSLGNAAAGTKRIYANNNYGAKPYIEWDAANAQWYASNDGTTRYALLQNPPDVTGWNSGNDGSGSGLDADLLDGYNSSAFVRKSETTTYNGGSWELPTYTNIRDGVNSGLAVLRLTKNNNQAGADIYLHSANQEVGIGVFNAGNVNDRKNLVLSYSGAITWNGNTVWTAGNHGHGSGLNADLLDGIHASSFIRTINGASPDANGAITVAAGVTSFNGRGGAVTLSSGDITGTLGYTPWHPNNDGAGSGLDADLLDGLNSTVFARRDTANTFSGAATFTAGAGGYGSSNAIQIISAADPGISFTHTSAPRTINLFLPGGAGAQLAVGGGSLGNVVYTLWHAGNMGPGSNLNADLLDGLQATAFLRTISNGYSNSTPDANGYTAVNIGVWAFNGRQGSVSLASSDVTSALGYTPWHPGNDGAGSGLDADLFDGLQTESFFRRDQINVWLTTTDGVQRFYFANNSNTYVNGNNQVNIRVDGNDRAYWNNSGMVVNGNVTASGGTVVGTSDIRTKYDIQTIDPSEALRILSQIRGVRFKFNGSSDENIGLISQEVQEAGAHELVKRTDDGNLSLAYGNSAGLIIPAINCIVSEYTSLRKRLEDVESLLRQSGVMA